LTIYHKGQCIGAIVNIDNKKYLRIWIDKDWLNNLETNELEIIDLGKGGDRIVLEENIIEDNHD